MKLFYLVVPHSNCLLLEQADVRDAQGVEGGDAGDGGHGRDLEVVHDRVHHDLLHEPRAGKIRDRSRRRLRLAAAGAAHELDGHAHRASAVAARRAPHRGHVAVAVAGAALAALEDFHGGGLQLEEPPALVPTGRREQRGPGVGGADVGRVQPLDAAVEVGDAAGHGVRAQELDDRGEEQGEEGEEEVHDVLAVLGVEHAPGLGVDQQPHAQRAACPCSWADRQGHPCASSVWSTGRFVVCP